MPKSATEALLETLLLPFEQGLLDWPGAAPVRFVNARDGWPLHRRPLPGLVCEQGWKPMVDALQRGGLRLIDESDSTQRPWTWVLPGRQRECARAQLARAVLQTAPGGCVLMCAANEDGARSLEADLRALVGPVQTLSKHHCRVAWSAPLYGAADPALAQAWTGLDAPRDVGEGRVSRPGLFAWDRIDPASSLLAQHLPQDLCGRGADFGAGTGYLARETLRRNPGLVAFDLFEAEARALALARINLAPFGARAVLEFCWRDVAAGVEGRYDVIVMNPPFHAQTREDRPDLGRRFIAVAAAALRPGGRLWLVANRHLPYEVSLGAGFGVVRTVTQRDGYKVIEARRAE